MLFRQRTVRWRLRAELAPLLQPTSLLHQLIPGVPEPSSHCMVVVITTDVVVCKLPEVHAFDMSQCTTTLDMCMTALTAFELDVLPAHVTTTQFDCQDTPPKASTTHVPGLQSLYTITSDMCMTALGNHGWKYGLPHTATKQYDTAKSIYRTTTWLASLLSSSWNR